LEDPDKIRRREDSEKKKILRRRRFGRRKKKEEGLRLKPTIGRSEEANFT
jgi:hypothetical protein